MKKIVSLILALALLFSLVSCSGNKPEQTVTSFCDAIKTYDFDAAAGYMKTPDKFWNPDDDAEILEGPSAEILVKYFEENISKMSYTLGETQLDGDTAIIPVTFTYADSSSVVTAAMGEYMVQAFSLALGGASDEQMSQLFENIFLEKAESIEPSMTTGELSFECVKIDGNWKIADFGEEAETKLMNVLTCNITNAFEELSDSMTDETNDESADEIVWHDAAVGDEVELETIKVKITECEEKKELTHEYLESDIAQEGTKFIVLKLAIENITKDEITFHDDLTLTDGEGRNYNTYDEALWYYDETFSYTSLAPNIVKEVFLVYNVPMDSSDYFLSIAKAGTNEGYHLYAK